MKSKLVTKSVAVKTIGWLFISMFTVLANVKADSMTESCIAAECKYSFKVNETTNAVEQLNISTNSFLCGKSAPLGLAAAAVTSIQNQQNTKIDEWSLIVDNKGKVIAKKDIKFPGCNSAARVTSNFNEPTAELPKSEVGKDFAF